MKNNYADIVDRIIDDERYLKNIQYGKPRRGHAEGTIEAHINELLSNLSRLVRAGVVSDENFPKLLVLIHVHDAFKADAIRNSAILDPKSHASLARAFLAEFCDSEDMLNIVQYHDLGYAVYRKMKDTGWMDEEKLMQGLNAINDLDLLLLFSIIDSCTVSKGREMITWFVENVNVLFPATTIKPWHILILPGQAVAGEVW